MITCACDAAVHSRPSGVRQQISIENEMNIQPQGISLFGSIHQDEAICGHNASTITVPVSLCALSLSLHTHTVAPIPERHSGFVQLIPQSSCSSTTLLLLLSRACLGLQAPGVPGWDLDWVGMRGMRIRVWREVWEGAGSVSGWMRRLKSAEHDWPGLCPTRITAASQGADGLMLHRHRRPLLVRGPISQDDPLRAAQWPQPLSTALTWTLCVHFSWSTHSCGTWHLRAVCLTLNYWNHIIPACTTQWCNVKKQDNNLATVIKRSSDAGQLNTHCLYFKIQRAWNRDLKSGTHFVM